MATDRDDPRGAGAGDVQDEIEDRDGEEREGEGREDAEDGEIAAEDAGEEQEVDEEADVEYVAPRSRNRIQAVTNERNELHRRVTELEGRLRETQRPQTPQEESDEQFNQRIALLAPDERMEARYERSERRNQQRLAFMQAQQQDALDKASYDAKATGDRRYQRYAQDVENLVAEQRRNGTFVSREVALAFIVGQRVLGTSAKEMRKVVAKRQQDVRRATTQPPNSRGDAGGRQRDSGRQARDRRLEDQEI